MDFEYTREPSREQKIESMLQSRTYRHYANTEPSSATKVEYARKLKLLHKAQQMPLEYCTERGLSKKTYNLMRYAVKHQIVQNLKAAQKSGDKAQMKEQLQYAKWYIKEDAREYVQERNATRERRQRESGKVSKRSTLRKLPSDWREQVQQQLQNSKYRDAALVLHLSGCRPGELVKGVEVSIKQDGSAAIYIKGCKQSEYLQSGQTLRRITYAADTPQAHALKALDKGEIKIESAQSFQKVYNAAATKALGRPGKRVTPYSARHQFSADMKKNGYSKTEIAAAMGHQSTRSQGQYGTGNQGKGGGGMTAQAQQQIRDPDRTPMQTQSAGPRM